MNYYENPTPHQEQANSEAMQHFAEHLNQFKATCDVLRSIEGNLSTTANDALKSALLASGHAIQTDDGAEWQHDVNLSNVTSVCHRRTAAGVEFAVVECLPLKSREMKEVLNSGHNIREVLQSFAHNQRQVLNLWKEDMKVQVREHLAEKYPRQDMGIVVESFEIKMARAISETRTYIHGQSRGIRI